MSSNRPTPSMSRAMLLGALIGVFALLLIKLPSQISAMEQNRKWEREVFEFAQLFLEIYGEINDRYVEEVDSEELFQGAIRGMFVALDPHSQWLPPVALQQLTKDTDGEFSGVGLHIQLDDYGVLTAISPIPGTPAALAGMQPGDRIVEIDGESTEGITVFEAVEKLTGPDGSKVVVTVRREGENELLHFTIVRDRIKVRSVFPKVLADRKIGYVRLTRFVDSTADDLAIALKEFKKARVEGIVVDLRFNSGGLLDKAIEICDFFLPKDQLIVSTRGRDTANDKEFYAKSDPLTDVPLVVLVNKQSASASEIFAGAMQDTGRGVIIGPEGQTTYGKGSVQTISPLRHSLRRSDSGEKLQSGLRLTTAKYFTPSGRTIHIVGVTPDVFVTALTRADKSYLFEHGLLLGDPDTSAIHESNGKANKEGGDAEKQVKMTDVQLEETINHLLEVMAAESKVAEAKS